MEYTYKYPRPAVTADCVVITKEAEPKVLLIQRGADPYKGCWAFPGGFMNMDETTEQCAIRELEEETGLKVSTVRQIGAYSKVDRDPRGRVITVAYYALVQKGSVKGGDDARNAQWYPINEIPQLAFDHEKILRVALKRLKERIHFQPIGFELLPEIFTMPQLQALYEAILEVHFDRRNFANKMLKLGVLEETGDRPKDAARTVPIHYRFNPDKYKEMKSKGFRLEF